MIKTITITITLDSESAYVLGADMVEGLYNRLELVGEGEKDSIYNTMNAIDSHMGDYLD